MSEGGFLAACKAFAGPAWTAFEHHPWIEALFANELDDDRFRFWLAQDLPYLGQHITEVAYAKVPPHNPLVALEREYARRSEAGRVELRLLDEVGPFGKTRWAARPKRDAFINFWVRTVHEGSFGDICAALYVCYSFDVTFGQRLKREATTGLPELQADWLDQWVDPFFTELRLAVEDGLEEAGRHASPHQRETMQWLFLRGVQHQIGTFDAAWRLSDPWPGETLAEQGLTAAIPPGSSWSRAGPETAPTSGGGAT